MQTRPHRGTRESLDNLSSQRLRNIEPRKAYPAIYNPQAKVYGHSCRRPHRGTRGNLDIPPWLRIFETRQVPCLPDQLSQSQIFLDM